jgi:hypothetical protein
MPPSCPTCQLAFEPLQGGYAPDGRIVCASCAAKLKNSAQKVEADLAGSAFPGSIGSVLLGLISFVLVHRLIFFLIPLMAIGFGAGTAWVAFSNPRTREKLARKRVPTMVLGVLGVALGVLSLIVSGSYGGE